MPMRKNQDGWYPDQPGWGLIDIQKGRSVYPAALVSAQPIEMTNWELQDFAVQVVRNILETNGRKLMS